MLLKYFSELELLKSLPFESEHCSDDEPNVAKFLYEIQLKKVKHQHYIKIYIYVYNNTYYLTIFQV